MKLPKYSNCSRSALTLIEVIASLLIVSVMILGSVRALHLHLEQANTSRAKSNAVKAADDLLNSWSDESQFVVPVNATGSVAIGAGEGRQPDRFQWRTRIVSRSPEVVGLNTVRLEFFLETANESVLPNVTLPTAVAESTLPTVTVDVVAYTVNEQTLN